MSVTALIALLFAGIPSLIDDVSEFVEDINEEPFENGDKFLYVVGATSDLIDEHCDKIPGWSELSEEARDRIIDGLVEMCVAAYNLKLAKEVEEVEEAARLAMPHPLVDKLRQKGLEAVRRRQLQQEGLARVQVTQGPFDLPFNIGGLK